jgi:hypothetical protein
MIMHSEAQVGKRKFPLFTIEKSSHSGLLSVIDTHDNDFTFLEVDLHAREKLKAKEYKFKIGQTFRGVLN